MPKERHSRARGPTMSLVEPPPKPVAVAPPRVPPVSRATRAVGYLRRSTDRQEQSIPDQQRAVEDYCAAHGLVLLRLYIDDAISGTSTAGRLGFQKMIADAQRSACDFGVVVCYDVKRFGRVGNDEAGYYRHLLRTSGVEVAYASENFAGDYTDDLLRPVKQWQARQESKDLSKIVIRGLLSRSTTGHWMGGAPPYGYDLEYHSQDGEFLFTLRYHPDGSKVMFDKRQRKIRTLKRGETIGVSRKDHCRLVPSDQPRVETVKRIFKLYVEKGMGYKAIAELFNRESVPPARGPSWSDHYSGQWAMTTVRAILVNPAYSGDMVWNRRTDARFHRIKSSVAVERKDIHARRLEPNDKADWTIVRDAHPALVTRRLWELAQSTLEAKAESISQRGLDQRLGQPAQQDFRKVGDHTGPRARFLLSRLVTCAKCGSRYEGFTQRARPGKNGQVTKTFYYACGGYIRRGKSVCGLNAVPQEHLEEAVIEAVLDHYARYAGEAGRRLLAREVRSLLGLEDDQVGESQKAVRAELAKIESTTRRLIDNVTPGTRAVAERRLKELEAERTRLTAKLESLERLGMSKAEVADLIEDTTAFISKLEPTLRDGPLEQRQVAMRRCVQRVDLDQPGGAVVLRISNVPIASQSDKPSCSAQIAIRLSE